MREEKFLICNLLNMVKLTFCFFFSGIKHVFHVVEYVKYVQC